MVKCLNSARRSVICILLVPELECFCKTKAERKALKAAK